jgi:hypothetical protein
MAARSRALGACKYFMEPLYFKDNPGEQIHLQFLRWPPLVPGARHTPRVVLKGWQSSLCPWYSTGCAMPCSCGTSCLQPILPAGY